MQWPTVTENPIPAHHISPRILVDADACPVKEEIYKVAWRRTEGRRGGDRQ